ncbi:uncharacterized protein METZ01_LOCUS297385, partial [marine metagenome]
MPKLTPVLGNPHSAVRVCSLLILTFSCFVACDSDATLGPSSNVVVGRIYAGHGFTCGIAEGGTGLCWGINDEGQLGVGGDILFGSALRIVSQDLRFVELSTKAAGRHVCGITTSEEAYCWGESDFGQLGNGSSIFRIGPQLVSGGLTFVSIAAGWRSSWGITTDG